MKHENDMDPLALQESSLALIEENGQLARRRKFWLRAIWISVVAVVVPPALGLVGTVIGMVGAFGTLSSTGAADPSELAGAISLALLTTLWGLVVSAVAFLFLIGFVIRYRSLPKPRNPSFPVHSALKTARIPGRLRSPQ